MSKSKHTPWFPGSVKPARVGVYQRILDDPSAIYYSLWDGYIWRWSAIDPDTAAKKADISAWLCATWRGLAQDPKVKK